MALTDPVDFSNDNIEQRRQFLQLLVLQLDAIADLSDKSGLDVTALAIQAIATELVHVGIGLMEAQEELVGMKAAVEGFGAVIAGLLGFETASVIDSDEEPDWTQTKAAMQRRGFELREAALS